MKWPTYPNYSNSGVEWVDCYPSAWSAKPLKTIASMSNGTSITAESIEESGAFPVYGGNGLRGFTSTYTHKGDRVLIGRQGALCGNVHLVSGRYWASEHAIVASPTVLATPRWLAYVLKMMDLGQYSQAAAQPGIAADVIGKLRVPTPSPPEQVMIADFLDRETSKIDALIGKQEKLISTLREVRTATITNAVTTGLHPHVGFRDSNTVSLDPIPSHWDAVPIKRLATRITDGAHVSPETEGGVYDFVSTKDVTDKGIDFDSALKTSPSSYDYLVKSGCQPQPGDVLFSKDGTIGRTVVVTEEREFVVASSLIIIRPDAGIANPLFVHYVCQALNVRQQVDSFVKGAGLPRLSISNLRRVVVAVPPMIEQLEIIEFLQYRCGNIDSLIAKAIDVIATLREYRSALITNAVTGKIDVRGAAA